MDLMKRIFGIAVVIVFLMCLFPEAKAANPLHKMGRGLKNIGIAPAEIPVAMVNWSNKKNPVVGLFIGPLAGAANCATRIAAGLVEIITFPMPPYDQPIYDRELGETIWE